MNGEGTWRPGPEPASVPAQAWAAPPAILKLDADMVHVWRLPLGLDDTTVQDLYQTLSDDERQRAARFHSPRPRQEFITARGLLRVVLGRYLEQAPRQLRFCYGAQGKPALTTSRRPHPLRFNLSHSHGLALLAVTQAREVGVDVEYMRPNFDCLQIAAEFFSPWEVAALRRLPAAAQKTGFFKGWTCKEAYLKARGGGLHLGLDHFDVALAPGEAARLLRTRPDPADAGRWTLQELTPGPGYAAALAVEGSGWGLCCWQSPLADASA